MHVPNIDPCGNLNPNLRVQLAAWGGKPVAGKVRKMMQVLSALLSVPLVILTLWLVLTKPWKRIFERKLEETCQANESYKNSFLEKFQAQFTTNVNELKPWKVKGSTDVLYSTAYHSALSSAVYAAKYETGDDRWWFELEELVRLEAAYLSRALFRALAVEGAVKEAAGK